ncbi:MAG: hypothetical protein GX998_11800 [Firmicutes bacterium]|nr:hypothetical protein [Bacillota bacterium]
MNIRERLEAFWAGEKPDKIPYTIYHNEWRHAANEPDWIPMFAAGLGVVYHVPTVNFYRKNIEYITDTYRKEGKVIQREVLETPLGNIYALSREGWMQKYWLETAEDYRIMTYIVENTELEPCYEGFLEVEQEVAPYGIPLVALGRTPMQRMLVDFAGLENFALHLYELEDAVMTLYEALLEQFARAVEIVAAGPGRFVSVLENFTAETLGPARFGRFHIPLYEKYFPVLQQSGKVVGTHYDGKLSSCRDLIAKAPIDVIESLTIPPEGDMTLAECREAWPDKLFWCNINVSHYDLPPDELKQVVWDMTRQGTQDGRRLAFEVSEHIPRNWRQSIPVILQVLDEIGNG